MIFDYMHDETGHMMDWFTPNGALIFLGVISFIIVVVILLFVLNRKPNREVYLEDTTGTITPPGKDKKDVPTDASNYCPHCGSKLDDGNSKFCALCGTKL